MKCKPPFSYQSDRISGMQTTETLSPRGVGRKPPEWDAAATLLAVSGVPHALGSGLGALCADLAQLLAGPALLREGASRGCAREIEVASWGGGWFLRLNNRYPKWHLAFFGGGDRRLHPALFHFEPHPC